MAKHILLVENHGDTANVMARKLAQAGYTVKRACNLCDAILMIRQDRFDAVLCDIGLPDGNGFELAKEIQQSRPIHTIALSELDMPNDLAAERAAGFHGHVTKPATIGEIILAIEGTDNTPAPMN